MNIIIARLETFAPNDAPAKRPTSISNQYVPTTKPAIVVFIPAPPLAVSSVRNRFKVPGTPTSIPTYTNIAIAPNTKWRKRSTPFIKLPIGSLVLAAAGSGILTKSNTMNASANTAIAVYITGKICEIVAFSTEPAIRIPTNIGVMVAITELNDPPIWIS